MKKAIIILLITAAFLMGCTKEQQKEQTVGGQTDEHSCLIGTGYSWHSEIGACTRSWELNQEQILAATEAVSTLSYPVTITTVEKLGCAGCYSVHLQRNDNRKEMVVNVTTEDQSKKQLNSQEFQASYANRKLTYSGTIEKPTPCHKVVKEVLQMESYPVQVRIDIKLIEPAEMCAQVITKEKLEGTVDLAEQPGSVSVYYQGQKVYSKSFNAAPLTEAEARAIAENDCAVGKLLENAVYNAGTQVWWIDFQPNEERAGCNPACVVNEQTKTAEINWRCTGLITDTSLTEEEARALAKNSECNEKGKLLSKTTYNELTQTWWIDFEPDQPKEGCSPACVVSEESQKADINWRCTGLIVR